MKKIIATVSAWFLFFISPAQITVTQNTNSIGRYDVYELTIQHPKSYPNNWEDVIVSTVFSGPQTINIDGFFFDTNMWKVRFAPPKTGSWTYAITFITPTKTYTANGAFTCVASATKGFLRQHPNNPFRLIYPDGTLFNGIGIGDCNFDADENGTPHDNWGFDGGFRQVGQEEGTDTTLNVYMNAYGSNGAGFNMFRWSIDNCAYNLYNTITVTGNTYLVREGMWGDTLVQSFRQNGIRLWLTFFGFNPPFAHMNGSTPLEEAAIKRYIRYVVARYGAYTDIWELYNEAYTSLHWITNATSWLSSIDPYKRLVSVNWDFQYPNEPSITVKSPHWYEKESEFASDQRSWDMITNEKTWNKPVIFGEQGNSVQNWDSLSALRMRIRSWTAFFAEGMFIFWNASFAKDYYNSGAAAIYLGPKERGYIRALQNFTSLADTTIQQLTITPSNPSNVRGYGLKSSKIIMGYFHHYSSHTNKTATSFKLNLPKAGTIYWINPANNKVVQSAPVGSGVQTITTPSFRIDLAMRIDIETALPITLISFYGKSYSSKNILYWTTAGEFNNNYFSLQRSSTGNDFGTITTINGASNSTQTLNYSFTDAKPFAGINYYRLQQTDYVGKTSFSKIISLKNSINNRGITIYPNPTSDFISILIADGNPADEIEILNAVGKTIIKIKNQNKIDISQLPPGVYFIKIQQGNNLVVDKFIKQ